MSATRVDRTERLLNLVVCLMATRHAVSRERIVEVVPGYADAPSGAALERMFERDKDELRALGIPIETVLDVNGEVEGYRIESDRYAMPEIHFSADERSALAVAAAVWGEAALGPIAARALHKLQAIDPGPDAPLERTPLLRLNPGDAAIVPLLRAIRLRQSVRFAYQGPSQESPQKRFVDPWGVVANEGFWYLVGFDRERGDVRVFRMSRIRESVTVVAQEQEYPMPENEDIRRRVRMLPEPNNAVTARVKLQPNAAANVRALAAPSETDPYGADELVIQAVSVDALASTICAGADQVVVEEPDSVREAVITGLQVVRDLHEDAS
jgi:proteasome accessory factor B